MLKSEFTTLVIFLLIVASVYILEFGFVIAFVLNKLHNRNKKNQLLTKPAVLIHILAVIGVICFLYGYFIEPYRVEVKEFQIRTDKLKQTSFRIVQISDLHCDRKVRNEEAVVEMVNNIKSDVIVFTGDAVNTPSALSMFKEMMKNLSAPLGKFAVYGNFEAWHWSGLDYYSGTGFELLDARTVVISKNGEILSFSGLSCDNPQAAEGLLEKLSSECFNVFLFHFSDLVEDLEGLNVDLYLCGHTHGGQVSLPFYGALVTMSKLGKKYESGMYAVGRTILYVNRGIGLEARPAPQVRFLARPEVTVFDIVPEN
jgi:predicted MPP superfamily phosphohydrolase